VDQPSCHRALSKCAGRHTQGTEWDSLALGYKRERPDLQPKLQV
jgi:hypothetical protein